MKIFPLIIILAAGLIAVSPSLSGEKEDEIFHYKTVKELNEAKKQGAIYLESGGHYFVRIGDRYQGPFKSFEAAKAERRKQLTGEDSQAQDTKGMFFPGVIIYPFMDITPERKVTFTIASGEAVPATRVMIHAEPLAFDKISYGPILLRKRGGYFAVTGQLSARENVVLATDSLKYWVGATVVSKDGEVLWQHYGDVESDLGFRCIKKVVNTKTASRYLLLFILGEGKLEKMLTAIELPKTIDANPYDYHILGSTVLEMGSHWFPAVEKAAREEYKKLIDSKKSEKKLPNKIPR